MSLRIEKLGRAHRPLLRDFRSQHASLERYLKRFALRHAETDLLARTFVAIDRPEGEGEDRLAGYFSLATACVARSSASSIPSLAKLPGFPIPALLLARLAVDVRVQGQGLGGCLFEEALGLSLQLAREGPVAFRLLITDAIDEAAASFYARYGLRALAEGYPCRMALDLGPLIGAPPLSS